MSDERFEDDVLRPEERRALRDLPRERLPDPDLEERIVGALRERGVLGRPRAEARGAHPAERWWDWRAAAAVAAAVALFVTGFALGQWSGTRTAVTALTDVQPADPGAAASAVQRAGSAYVGALTSLLETTDSASPEELDQGRQVAMAALYAAASKVLELDPDDPLATGIMLGLEEVRRREGIEEEGGEGDGQWAVWF